MHRDAEARQSMEHEARADFRARDFVTAHVDRSAWGHHHAT
jgi:hypothetical protein